MAPGSEIRDLLDTTSMPEELVDSLLHEASAWWLAGERPDVLAGDLALCHPPLREGEVRAAVRSTSDPGAARFTVVASDHPIVLPAMAAALASAGLLITKVAATTFAQQRMVLVGARVVDPDGDISDSDWRRIADEIKVAIVGGRIPDVEFAPRPPVRVQITPQGDGRSLVVVTAPHRVGSLWATASWLTEHGCAIEVVHLEAAGDVRETTFLLRGDVDAGGLVQRLGGGPPTNPVVALIGTVIASVRRLLPPPFRARG